MAFIIKPDGTEHPIKGDKKNGTLSLPQLRKVVGGVVETSPIKIYKHCHTIYFTNKSEGYPDNPTATELYRKGKRYRDDLVIRGNAVIAELKDVDKKLWDTIFDAQERAQDKEWRREIEEAEQQRILEFTRKQAEEEERRRNQWQQAVAFAVRPDGTEYQIYSPKVNCVLSLHQLQEAIKGHIDWTITNTDRIVFYSDNDIENDNVIYAEPKVVTNELFDALKDLDNEYIDFLFTGEKKEPEQSREICTTQLEKIPDEKTKVDLAGLTYENAGTLGCLSFLGGLLLLSAIASTSGNNDESGAAVGLLFILFLVVMILCTFFFIIWSSKQGP